MNTMMRGVVALVAALTSTEANVNSPMPSMEPTTNGRLMWSFSFSFIPPTPEPTPEPIPTPTEAPTPLPSSQPTPVPTPAPSVTFRPTPVPTSDDTVKLVVKFGISGDGACNLAANYSDTIRYSVAKKIKIKDSNRSIGEESISGYDVEGCGSSRRRRRLLGKTATISITFSQSTGSSGFSSGEALYDAATESLKDAINDLTTELATACGCTISVDTIKLELTTRWEPEETGSRTPAPAPVTPYYAGADCPNGCSGHGSCSTNGCVCWSHWGNGDETGGACDQRKCPYEIAWVDTPSSENKAHALRECAGRGICDRDSGDCACFPGFEGKGCRRTTCPNECSGHGTCEYMSELRNDLGDGFKWTGSKPTRDQYDFEFPLLWDAHKTRGCVCDPKFTGLDCSIRMCPKGDFPSYYKLEKTSETQAIIFTNIFTPGTDADRAGMPDYKTSSMNNGTDDNGEFALTFRSTLNEEYTTATMNVYNLTEAQVENALNSLPNKVIEEASAVVYRNLSKYNQTQYYHKGFAKMRYGDIYTGNKFYPYGPANSQFNYTWYDTDLVVLVTYSGAMTTGDQYALECRTAYCGAGCQPKLENPIDFKEHSECLVVNNYNEAIATNWECSGRGQCGEDGVCECYEGYTDEYCSTKTAII